VIGRSKLKHRQEGSVGRESGWKTCGQIEVRKRILVWDKIGSITAWRSNGSHRVGNSRDMAMWQGHKPIPKRHFRAQSSRSLHRGYWQAIPDGLCWGVPNTRWAVFACALHAWYSWIVLFKMLHIIINIIHESLRNLLSLTLELECSFTVLFYCGMLFWYTWHKNYPCIIIAMLIRCFVPVVL
jgi:hypothetical protein